VHLPRKRPQRGHLRRSGESGRAARRDLALLQRTRWSFQRRCSPADIRSFITSYLGATAAKTSATRPCFSATGTSRKPEAQQKARLSAAHAQRAALTNRAARARTEVG
jgi:hypothetical protein